ncbi:hypothetical protein DTO271D3_7770 [Paecilomyces variotii]|nr:hypothetical protein DTO032I3_101 [Paecilomyces variotii]KAJ9224778.1 hypothetical protein DTO169C6_3029 [Paecilomyces variotii]KAJ9252411.1 hypothetical protein DTO207G8_4752 [Paecilomyces variotii]KAJ9254043.1 hypothetical protein DTO195F2_6799 [Paecilomyces variotii]KAJ9264823.1 hypothetical protein DTO212C5_6939 [Paecilomyces variotii]
MLNLRSDHGHERAGDLSSERAVIVRGGLDPAPSILLVCVRFKGKAWSKNSRHDPYEAPRVSPAARFFSSNASAFSLCCRWNHHDRIVSESLVAISPCNFIVAVLDRSRSLRRDCRIQPTLCLGCLAQLVTAPDPIPTSHGRVELQSSSLSTSAFFGDREESFSSILTTPDESVGRADQRAPLRPRFTPADACSPPVLIP